MSPPADRRPFRKGLATKVLPSFAVASALLLAALPVQEAWAKGKGHPRRDAHPAADSGVRSEGTNDAPDDIRPEVFRQLLRDNPGLTRDFLRKDAPDRMIKLSNGAEYPLYQLAQFLDHNFRMNLKAAKPEGEKVIAEQEWKMHRLMARPEIRDWFREFGKTYKVNGRAVGWERAYAFLRGLHNTVVCGVTHPGQMPHGGGGHAMAPSWAVWKKLNLLFHEAANGTRGFSGDDPVMTGVLAGKLEKMDNKRLWDYPTVDVNTGEVSHPRPPYMGNDTADKAKGKKRKD